MQKKSKEWNCVEKGISHHLCELFCHSLQVYETSFQLSKTCHQILHCSDEFRVICTAACGRRPHLGVQSCFLILSDFGIGRTPSATKFIRIQSQGALVLLAPCVGSLPRGSPRASVASRLFFFSFFSLPARRARSVRPILA